MKICRLELIEKELKNSHVIPKFAFDYLKSTGSKYLRSFENPNKRLQDGIKEYLLCDDCEQLFSKRERWFANTIFFPYLNKNKTEFKYDENLGYFVISLLWRVLVNQQNHYSVKDEGRLAFLSEVECEWRQFLTEFKYPRNFNNFNILLTDGVQSNNTDLVTPDYFFTRLIDFTIVHNNDFTTVAVYAKFLRFIFWVPVKGYEYIDGTTNINLNEGILKTPQNLDDTFIKSFFVSRIRLIDNADEPNEEQEKKIMNEILKDVNGFWASDLGRSILNDSKNSI